MLAKVGCTEFPFLDRDPVFYECEGPAKVLVPKGQEVIMKDCGLIVRSHAFRVTAASGNSNVSAETAQGTERCEKDPQTEEHVESQLKPL